MPTYARPGIYVDEVLLAETAPQNTTTAIAAFCCAAQRGPTTPTLIQSWGDVNTYFGGFTGVAANDVLVQALYDAFQTGARTCYAARVAGSGAVAATLPFNLPPVGETSAVPGIDFTAASVGAWGNDIYVEVDAGTSATRFNLLVRIVPTGAVITNSQIVERWADLSLDPNDPRYVLRALNSAINGSRVIRAGVHSGYIFASGDVLDVSSAAGGSKLTAGADGSAVVSADIVSTIYLFDAVVQPMVLNMPGVVDSTTIEAVADYVDPDLTRTDGQPGRGDVFVVVDSAPGLDSSTQIATVSTYPVSDYFAVYYPALVVPDKSNNVLGTTKLVPCGPSVVGRYMSTDATTGPFKAPAGIVDGFLPNVVALDPAATLRNPDLDALNLANVNAIKNVPGSGICIFGARTLLVDYVTRYVNARRTLIDARSNLIAATQFAPFRNNDQFLWSDLYNAADKYLRALYVAGGLKGSTPADAYYITCDDTNNTTQTIQAGEVHLEVGLALQQPAEFVVIQIGQFDGSTTVDISSP